MDVRKILEEATKREASDIFIIAGRPLTYKSKGAMNTLDDQRMEPKDTFQFVSAIYTLAERNIDDFDRTGDDDFSLLSKIEYVDKLVFGEMNLCKLLNMLQLP